MKFQGFDKNRNFKPFFHKEFENVWWILGKIVKVFELYWKILFFYYKRRHNKNLKTKTNPKIRFEQKGDLPKVCIFLRSQHLEAKIKLIYEIFTFLATRWRYFLPPRPLLHARELYKLMFFITMFILSFIMNISKCINKSLSI